MELSREEKDRLRATLKQLASVVPPHIASAGIGEVREYKAWLGEACKMVKNDRPNYTRIQDLIGRFRFMCTPEFRKKLQDSGIQWGKS